MLQKGNPQIHLHDVKSYKEMIMTTQKLSMLVVAIVGLTAFGGSQAVANDLELLIHARQLRAQVTSFHQTASSQLRYSPYEQRICRLSDDLLELACTLEEEVRNSCTCNRAEWIVARIERKRDNLDRVIHTAIHRASVGIDPYAGCLQRLEVQFHRIDDIVNCMHESVHVYRPVVHAHQTHRVGHGSLGHGRGLGHGSGIGHGHHGHSSGYRGGSQLNQRSGVHFHGNGITVQRGSFRFTFGS